MIQATEETSRPAIRPPASLPGPSLLGLFCQLPRLRRDPLQTLTGWTRQYGDIFQVPMVLAKYFLNNPADIRHVLVSNQANYRKTGSLVQGKLFLGEGLLTSEGDAHLRQRRMIQPGLHSRKISRFGELMASATDELAKSWRDGTIVDIEQEMVRLTLTIVGKALFSVDMSHEVREIYESVKAAQRYLIYLQTHLPLPAFFRASRERRYREAVETLNKAVYRLIEHHRAAEGQFEDLLSMLLNVRYEDGSPMSDQQIRDEALIMLVAGHETTSNSLSWTWYLLSQHPEAEARLLAEAQSVLNGRLPEMADLPRLGYVDRVFSESLRLYPPAWMLGRRSVEEDTLPSGVMIPPKSELAIMPYAMHRHPRYFPDPDRFDPERFLPANTEQRPACAYIPFGAGARSCIGEPFARMEATIILATLVSRCHFTLVPGQTIEPEPLLNIRPKYGLRMQIKRR